MWTHTEESQAKISPHEALEYLKLGNKRFRNNLKLNRNLLKQVNQTSEGQFPIATILSCIDSRTSAELIFDQGLGDIFSIRIAGNILNSDILGSMEYACAFAKSKVIVVLGHSQCGAVISACNQLKAGHLTGLLDKLKPSIEKEVITPQELRNGKNLRFVNQVSLINVHETIRQIREQSKILSNLENEGKIIITGGFYEIETGEVSFFSY